MSGKNEKDLTRAQMKIMRQRERRCNKRIPI